MIKIQRILGALIGLLLLTAYQPKTYEYGFNEGGIGGPGWPTWVEYLIINEAWQVPVSNLSGGDTDTSQHPPVGASADLGPIPLVHTIRARWFSYRTQTFYEATTTISEAQQQKIKQWIKRYPVDHYLHSLVTGFAGQGEIQLWWNASCVGRDCPEDHLERHYFELTPRIKATVAEGDPNQYDNTTREHIREGTIPPEVLDLVSPLENSYARYSGYWERSLGDGFVLKGAAGNR